MSSTSQKVKAPHQSWVMVSYHCDGRSVKGFHTEKSAKAALAAYVTVTGELKPQETYVDDNGGTHFIEQLQVGMDTNTYRRLTVAYDNREMGKITAVQKNLLTHWGW